MLLLTRAFSYTYRQRTKTLRLISLGVFVHFILFVGVMDIYFASPVQHGLPSHSSDDPLCRRVVVFVSDGLRAEGIFDKNNSKLTPFLTHIKDNVGAWGIAHTRVPTESRPGHVAIFAGMYEDPHAVTKGWKYNPIDFDHVFNQSKASFLWGSPDIVPMFNKDSLKNIYTEFYEPSFEDFSGQQSTILLDDWVFEKVKSYFKLNRVELRQDKSIFFLHLLGMDTAGHVYKPNTKKYYDNLAFVDKGIYDIVKILEDFFNDDQTIFIFTSDHGMTDWGSHGSGSAHETESPFIIWGARVKRNSTRQDLMQADITNIISAMLGINIPINSVGVFREHYFDLNEKEVANILYANVMTLSEQYKAQQHKMRRNLISLFYDQLQELKNLNNVTDEIQVKIKAGKYQEAISDLKNTIHLIEKGKVSNSQYLRSPMLMCLAIGLGMFMIYTASMILGVPQEVEERHAISEDDLINVCSKIVLSIGLTLIFLLSQNVELKYCLYICFPLAVMLCLAYDVDQMQYLVNLIVYVKLKHVGSYALILMGVSSLSLTFFYREYIFYISIGVLIWMLFGNMSHLLFVDKLIWSSIMLYLPLFYTLSIGLKEMNHIVSIIGAVIMMCIPIATIFNGFANLSFRRMDVNYFHLLVVTLQLLCLFFSCINVVIVSYYSEISGIVMQYIYTSSWTIFVLCLVTMTLHPRKIFHRSIGIQISLFNIYFLMSFNGESLFLALFIILCLTWSFTEMRKLEILGNFTRPNFGDNNMWNAAITHDDFRRCFVFVTLTLMSFFGTGNISDLNTFDPMWTKCFVKVFSPFLIFTLIAFKLVIPFFITTVTFQSINVFGRISTISCFSIILLYSDVMVLNMMFRVTNEGSWLEIGLSISRFVITIVIAVALLLIYTVTQYLTENQLFDILSAWFHRILGVPIIREAIDDLQEVAEHPRDE